MMTAGRVVFAAIAFVASFGPAWLSWHLFEKHVLKLKDHFPYHKAEQRAEASAATGQRIADRDPLTQPPTS